MKLLWTITYSLLCEYRLFLWDEYEVSAFILKSFIVLSKDPVNNQYLKLNPSLGSTEYMRNCGCDI